MKRLLLGPVLAIPLWLGLCHMKTPEVPKVPEVIGSVSSAAREIPLDNFNTRFPPNTTTPQPAPEAPAVTKEKPRARVGAHRRPAVHHPVPLPRPPMDQAPVETLPPQQGPICIFPFNMIPKCTPGVP